jgi:hypothetical protein
MGDVRDYSGRTVGSVDAWNGVYDTMGRKVGSVDIYSSRVYNAAGQCVGSADIYGKVCDSSGRFVCQVAFFGFKVTHSSGSVIGSVDNAGAPDPPPDMQWRGAAALLLLCQPRVDSPPMPVRRIVESQKSTGCAEILGYIALVVCAGFGIMMFMNGSPIMGLCLLAFFVFGIVSAVKAHQ